MKIPVAAALVATVLPLAAEQAPPEIPPFEHLAAQVESLRVTDVPWRKIPWKTCPLDALATSAKEQKPVVVWMFIDHPVDDKRC